MNSHDARAHEEEDKECYLIPKSTITVEQKQRRRGRPRVNPSLRRSDGGLNICHPFGPSAANQSSLWHSQLDTALPPPRDITEAKRRRKCRSPALSWQAHGPFSFSARAHDYNVNNKNQQRGLRRRDALTTTDEQPDAKREGFFGDSVRLFALQLSFSLPLSSNPTRFGRARSIPENPPSSASGRREGDEGAENRRVRPLGASVCRPAVIVVQRSMLTTYQQGRATLCVKLKLPHASNFSLNVDEHGITVAMGCVKSTEYV